MLHDVLTYGGEEEDDIFCAEEKVEEISIGSSDEDDPFVSKKAAEVLRKLARNKRDFGKFDGRGRRSVGRRVTPPRRSEGGIQKWNRF